MAQASGRRLSSMVLAPVMQVVLTISIRMVTATLPRPAAVQSAMPAPQMAKAAAAVAASLQRRRFQSQLKAYTPPRLTGGTIMVRAMEVAAGKPKLSCR